MHLHSSTTSNAVVPLVYHTLHDGLGCRAGRHSNRRTGRTGRRKGKRVLGVGILPARPCLRPVLPSPSCRFPRPLPPVPSTSPLHTSPLSACKISPLAVDWSLLRQSAVGAKLLRVAAQIDGVLGESIKHFVVGSDTTLEHARKQRCRRTRDAMEATEHSPFLRDVTKRTSWTGELF